MKKILKYLLYVMVSLVVFSILLFVVYHDQIEISAVIPPRPDNISKSAFWVGGPDGGMYVLVKKNERDRKDIYYAEIYHSSGNISYKGKLVINSPDNPLFDYKDVNSYSGWDGDHLLLQDGRYLTIVDE